MEKNNHSEEILVTDSVTGASFVVRPATKKELTLHQAIEVNRVEGGKGFVKAPTDLEKLMRSIFKKLSFTPKDYLGESDNQHRWQLPEQGEALFHMSEQHKLEKGKTTGLQTTPTPPSNNEKNLHALAGMLQKENYRRGITGIKPTGELSFLLSEYALSRGYTEEQVAKGSVPWDQLKKDLVSGAKTTYSVKWKSKEGKEYTRHGFPSFYYLDEPKNKKDKWILSLNEPWKHGYIAEDGQFSPVLIEAIQDRSTDGKKRYLFSFHMLVLRYGGAWKGRKRPALKVKTVLDDIGIGEFTLSRPKESYETLSECIQYANKQGIIKEIAFKAHLHKRERITIEPDRFNSLTYGDFITEVLAPLGIGDVREALVSFSTVDGLLDGGKKARVTPNREEGESHGGEEVTSL